LGRVFLLRIMMCYDVKVGCPVWDVLGADGELGGEDSCHWILYAQLGHTFCIIISFFSCFLEPQVLRIPVDRRLYPHSFFISSHS